MKMPASNPTLNYCRELLAAYEAKAKDIGEVDQHGLLKSTREEEMAKLRRLIAESQMVLKSGVLGG